MSRAFGLILLVTLVTSCLLGPIVYSGLLAIYPDLPWPYSRVFDRVLLLILVVLLFVKRREFGLGGVGALLNPQGRWELLAKGVLISLACSAILVPFFIWNGDLTLNVRDVSYYLAKMPKIILGAVLTALIEEFIFRGVLFRELKARHSLRFAAILTTLIYASVHFIAPDKKWIYPGYSPLIGFEYLGVVLQGVLNPQHFTAFIGLCFVGLVLIRSLLLTESLVLAVGLHAGWILSVKSVFHLTTLNLAAQPGLSPLATRYFLVSSPIAWISILLVGIVLTLLTKRN